MHIPIKYVLVYTKQVSVCQNNAFPQICFISRRDAPFSSALVKTNIPISEFHHLPKGLGLSKLETTQPEDVSLVK